MARYYDQPIQMICDGDGVPVRFIWRETTYQVQAVLARWHLRDRWWATEAEGAAAATDGSQVAQATDRFYWRLHCASAQSAMVFCIVYYDAAAAVTAWRLERVYD